MHWTPRDKIILRRALREMKKAADTALVSGFLHPDNGSKVTPSETLRSVAHLFASIWGVDINPPASGAADPLPNPHKQPREGYRLRVKRRADAEQADK